MKSTRKIQFVLLSLFVVLRATSAIADRSPRMCTVKPRPVRETPSAACVRRPTTHLDLIVNLDADAVRWSLPGRSGQLGYRIPNHSISVEIQDPNGRPRTIVVSFIREPGNDWIVVVGPPRPEPTQEEPFQLVLPDAQTSARLMFDEHGRLVEPSELRIILPLEAVTATNSDSTELLHLEQKLVLGFRTDRGATTQYSGSFEQLDVDQDGLVCRQTQKTRGGCLLASDLRGVGIGGEGASIHFDVRGRLISNAWQRIRGRGFDLLTGERDELVSDARIPLQLIPPRATQQVNLELELDATAPLYDVPFDVADPRGTSQFWTPVPAFDAVGRSLPLALYLSRATNDDWSWTLAIDRWYAGSDVLHLGFDSDAVTVALEIPPTLVGVFSNGPVPPPAEVLEGGRGTLRFDSEGSLTAIAQEGIWLPGEQLPVVRRPAPSAAEVDQEMSIDFGLALSRLANAHGASRIEQDGYGSGRITNVRVSRDYVLEAGASNGVWAPISELSFAEPGDAVCRFDCSDRRDDDADGRVDFPGDPGCTSGFDGSETSFALVCDNDVDDDDDGLEDYPDDPGCSDPLDDDEGPLDLALEVVKATSKRKREEQDLVVALLYRGGAPLSSIDPAGLRLEPGGFRVSTTNTATVASAPIESTLHLDANCDGIEDRLFRFSVDPVLLARGHGEICLSGVLDPAYGPQPPAGSLESKFWWLRFDRSEFRACTRWRRQRTRLDPE